MYVCMCNLCWFLLSLSLSLSISCLFLPQSVLDSTYYEECQLVEQEFPVSIASKTIIHLITSLATPIISCGSPERVATQLGTELPECVYWRVGSLMYMYCHTLMEEDGRRKEVNEYLIEQVGNESWCLHVVKSI